MKMNKSVKRWLSILLCLCMVLQYVPVAAFATDGDLHQHSEEITLTVSRGGTVLEDNAYVYPGDVLTASCSDANAIYEWKHIDAVVATTAEYTVPETGMDHRDSFSIWVYDADVTVAKGMSFVYNAPCTCDVRCTADSVNNACAVCASDMVKCVGICTHTFAYGTCIFCYEVCEHKSYTDGVCDGCGISCDHSGNTNKPTLVDESNHSYTCSVCNASVTEEHNWTDGEYISNGVTHNYGCPDCRGIIEGFEHNFIDHVCACGKADVDAKVSDGNSTTYYDNFATALENWADGTTLTLLRGVEYGDEIWINGNSVTLDLKGCTLSASKGVYVGDSPAALTVQDSVGGGTLQTDTMVGISGTLTLTGGRVKGRVYVNSTGTFVMSGGKVDYSRVNAIEVCGNAEISGGTIQGRYGIWNNGTTTVSGSPTIIGTDLNGNNPGAAIAHSSGTMTISGTPDLRGGGHGELFCDTPVTLNTQPADGVWRVYMEKSNGVFKTGVFANPGEGVDLNVARFAAVAEGQLVQKNENGTLELIACTHESSEHTTVTPDEGGKTHSFTCTVCNTAVTGDHTFDTTTGKCVCTADAPVKVQVGENVTYYPGINEANAYAGNLEGSETLYITLQGDTAINNSLIFAAKNIVLDLNGHTMTVEHLYYNSGADVTVKDSGTNGKILITESHNVSTDATLTLESGWIRSTSQHNPAVYVYGSFIMKGGKLSSDANTAIGVQASDATVNISGGTIESSSYWALANGSGSTKISLSGGTYIGGIFAPNDGIVLSAIVAEGYKLVDADGNDVDLTSYKVDGTVRVVCAHTLEHEDNVAATCTEKAYCGTCGEYYGNVDEDAHTFDSTDGKCQLCDADMAEEAKVTSGDVDTYYEKLTDALANAKSGDTVSLCDNVNMGDNDLTIPAGVTFDTGPVYYNGRFSEWKYRLSIGYDNGLLNHGTVNYANIHGVIYCYEGSSLSNYTYLDALVIRGDCNIDLSTCDIPNGSGIRNETEADLKVADLKLRDGYALEVDNGDVVSVLPINTWCWVSRHEHTYESAYDATHHWTECACGKTTEKAEHDLKYTDNKNGTHTMGCSGCDYTVTEGHTFDSTDGKCVNGCGAQAVAKVGETFHLTLAEAITAVSTATAEDNAVVKLLDDIPLTATQEIEDGVFTLDLNGHSITADSNVLYVTSGVTLTLTDSATGGSISSANSHGVNARGSTVTITGGTISGFGSSNSGVYADSGTVTITGGTVTGTYGVSGFESTVTINGGTVTGNTSDGVHIYGNNNRNSVTISGGTVTGKGRHGVNVSGGSVTINGGTISGATYGVDGTSTSVSVEGGTITGGSHGVYSANNQVKISGGTITGGEADIYGNVYLDLGDNGTGATFPGGITVGYYTLKGVLASGAAYWQGGKMIIPTEGQTEITGGDVTIKAECKHTNVTAEYEPYADDLYAHNVTWSCCGAVIKENCSDSTITVSDSGAGCTYTCSDCGQILQTYEIVAPACKTYGDGNSCKVTLRENDEESNSAVTYYLWKNEAWEKQDAAPTNAGSYRAEYVVDTLDDTTTEDDIIIYVAYTIAPATITADMITLPTAVYTGEGQIPNETVTVNGVTLTRNTDYSVTTDPEDYINAGNYPATVVGKGNYTGRVAMTFIIEKATPEVTAPTAIENLIYTGEAQTLITAGSTSGGTMQYKVGDGKWSADLPTATDAGTYTVSYKVVGNDNYNDVAADSVTVTIARASLADATVTLSETSFTYDGQSHKPAVTVKLGDKTLTLGVDYTVIYAQAMTVTNGKPVKWFGTGPSESECINAGSLYFAVVEGIGNYYTEDTVTLCENFVIEPRSLTVKAADQTILVGGWIDEESVTVTEGSLVEGHTLTASVLFDTYSEGSALVNQLGTHKNALSILQMSCEIMAGEENVTRNYSLTFASGNLTVVKHEHAWTYTASGDTITAECKGTIGDCPEAEQTITIMAQGKSYDGTAVTATLDISGEDLTAPTISYSGNTTPGTYTASITIGDATASVEFTITIPEAILSPATPNGENGWYKNASLLAPNGYAISTIKDGTFGTQLDLPEKTHESFTYWLTYTENRDCEPVSLTLTDSVKIDGTAPTVSGAAASVTASTASITVSADDKNSGVAGTTLTCTDSSVTIGALADGAFPVSGMKPNTAYTFTLTVKDAAGNEASATVKLTTEKAVSSVTEAPTAKSLTYTGEAQALVNAGATDDGKLVYSLSEDGAFTETIPTGKDAGQYTLWYYVIGDENHFDSPKASVKVTIAKAKAAITVDTTTINVTYGETVTLPAATTNFGTVTCDKTAADLKNAGTYTVTYTVAGAANFEGDTKTLTVNIDKKAVAEPTVTGTYTYTGEAQTVTLTGVENYMTVASGNKGTNAGNYEVEITLDGNHKWADGSDGKLQWTIAQKPVTVTAKDQTISYGGSISGKEVAAAGLIEGHAVTATLTPSTKNVTVKGTITASAAVITAGGTDVTANYTITYTSGKLVIQPDTAKIDALTTSNVTSADEEDIKAVQAMMASAESLKEEWKTISENCEELLEKIEAVQKENGQIAEALNGYNLDTVKSSDEEKVNGLLNDIKKQLATGNLTDEERTALESLKSKCESLNTKIEGTETQIGQLEKELKDLDAETVKPTDKAALEQAIKDAQALINSGNVTEAEKETLKQIQKDAQALIEAIEAIENHKHEWQEATCTAPKTCKTCGATEGSAKGHSWADATCTAPKTCSVCGATEGSAKGHSWADATCTAPKTCSVCGATEGSAKGHSWADATCTVPKTCKTCGATEGSAKGHSWADATCTAPKTCTVCGITEGTVAPHAYNQEKVDPKYLVSEATCTALAVYRKSCQWCGLAGEETFTAGELKPHRFTDVPGDAYYHDPVLWAVEKGITNGTGDGATFEPNGNCTRAQIVTFLWRAAGMPEPSVTENPFTDVQSDDYFYKAVLWAFGQGVTKGTKDGTTFEPGSTCTRGQIVTMLARYLKGAPVSNSNPFVDVPAGVYYTDAVLWAVEQGITTGTKDGATFEPNSGCTRGQAVTFLWRACTK